MLARFDFVDIVVPSYRHRIGNARRLSSTSMPEFDAGALPSHVVDFRPSQTVYNSEDPFALAYGMINQSLRCHYELRRPEKEALSPA